MANEKHLDPAKAIIAKFGGAPEVATVTGRSVSRVYRWMYPQDKGGTGGFIPQPEARKLLDYAAEHDDIDLSPAEFFGAGSVPEPAE